MQHLTVIILDYAPERKWENMISHVLRFQNALKSYWKFPTLRTPENCKLIKHMKKWRERESQKSRVEVPLIETKIGTAFAHWISSSPHKYSSKTKSSNFMQKSKHKNICFLWIRTKMLNKEAEDSAFIHNSCWIHGVTLASPKHRRFWKSTRPGPTWPRFCT